MYRQKNVYEKLKANYFIQNYYANINLQNPKTFFWTSPSFTREKWKSAKPKMTMILTL